jgi:hypothetical protein
MKTFSAAGVSKLNGKFALRATNREGDTYAALLKKEGHTDVHMVQLKHAMGKEEIRKYLPGLKAFQTTEILAFLKDAGTDTKETVAAKAKVSKPAKSKAPAKAKAKAKAKPKQQVKEDTGDDGTEVETAEVEEDDVDVDQELGIPAFLKHVEKA